jgi:flavin-dependent dehydrogenase
MQVSERTAIVGGGPAGALVAALLASRGREVLLFDEKLAWEKPCGGGLTDKALARWPFLREAEVKRNWIDRCELFAPSGRRASFSLDRPIAIFSRLALNGLMLERARDSGAQLHRERVVEIEGRAGQWKIRTPASTYAAEFVVIATGARNAFRNQFTPPPGPENFMVAAGYYIPGHHRTVQIKFLRELEGYIWIFPRVDHFSAGICGRMKGKTTAELRQMLDESLPEFGLNPRHASFYAHIIPSLTVDRLRNGQFSGEGWAMIGDAAGFVDAITGEGLYYALRSAELAAMALLADEPETYAALVHEDFLPELEHAAQIRDRFYAGAWMGASVIERMIQLTGHSSQFRDLMRDLFAGSQEYSNLRERLYRSLPRIAAEALVNTLWNRKAQLGATDETGLERFAGAGTALDPKSTTTLLKP